MKYPPAPAKRVVETLHSHKIVDNYRLFEDPTNPQVKKWVDEQNRLCEKSIPKALRTRLAKALQKQFEHKGVHVPGKRGELYFWSERQPKEDQWVLYFKKGLKGKPQSLIDPNKLSTKNRIVSLYELQNRPLFGLRPVGWRQRNRHLKSHGGRYWQRH